MEIFKHKVFVSALFTFLFFFCLLLLKSNIDDDFMRSTFSPGTPPLANDVDPVNSNFRKEAIKAAFIHSWKPYQELAFGMDEFHPISKTGSNWFGLGMNIIDSLDTMLLMGLKAEFTHCLEWIEKDLSFEKNNPVNLFETTIRVLGGLLSAYSLTREEVLLIRAKDLGDRLIVAFDTPSGIPFSDVVLGQRKGQGGLSSTSEVATLQLEFKYLSYITQDPKYTTAAEKVIQIISESSGRIDGLVPIFISPKSGEFSSSEIRLGSRGDSYYEYLLKLWLQGSQKNQLYRQMYDESVQGIRKHLLKYSEPSKLPFISELPAGIDGMISPKMDHLVCFLPGVLALGATKGKKVQDTTLSESEQDDLDLAEGLMYSCYRMYRDMATGLSPEIVYFNTDPREKKDITVHQGDTHNLLRPETVESLFVLYKITRNQKYQDWGWTIWEAFETYTRVEGGYSTIKDVTTTEPTHLDKTETFFLAETLKYLYLLFEDTDSFPLDQYVFNTEAHPLPILDSQNK